MSMDYKINHQDWTRLAVAANSDTGLSVAEYDEFIMMLYAARVRIEWMAEQKGCSSCKFWQNGCEKADFAKPPEAVQKTGCEVYENRHTIPY